MQGSGQLDFNEKTHAPTHKLQHRCTPFIITIDSIFSVPKIYHYVSKDLASSKTSMLGYPCRTCQSCKHLMGTPSKSERRSFIFTHNYTHDKHTHTHLMYVIPPLSSSLPSSIQQCHFHQEAPKYKFYH